MGLGCEAAGHAHAICAALPLLFLSKCLHSLVHLSLPSGMIEADVCALEAAWGYFEEALSILDSAVSWEGAFKAVHRHAAP